MKSFLYLLVTLPFTYNFSGTDLSTANFENSDKIYKNEVLADAMVGQWKRTASGQDANNNRILEESEKMKLEPGAQDNLHLNSDGKCKVFGMGMELQGTWLTKMYNGKKTLFIYTNDLADKPQPDRDKSAMRFEIVSLENGKLVVIPPMFSFMLSVYSRSN